VSSAAPAGCVVWLTGVPSSGKSTLARRAAEALRAQRRATCVLDGDAVRAALVPAFGYDERSRQHFYTSLANLASLLAQQGLVVLVPATAHRAGYRDYARSSAPRFIEVYVDARADAEQRDSKGLYQAARAGRTQDIPGADLAYEPPPSPDVRARGGKDPEALERLLAAIG
jgi:adenylylsulfate kinase